MGWSTSASAGRRQPGQRWRHEDPALRAASLPPPRMHQLQWLPQREQRSPKPSRESVRQSAGTATGSGTAASRDGGAGLRSVPASRAR